jgi:hypothetical protein
MEKFVYATDLDKTKTLDELREELNYYRTEFVPTGMAGNLWRDARITSLLLAISNFHKNSNSK